MAEANVSLSARPRRPVLSPRRCRVAHCRDPAFSLPALAAATAACAALAATLRALLTRRVRRRLAVAVLRFRRGPRPWSRDAVAGASASTVFDALDAVGARAAAQLQEAAVHRQVPTDPAVYATLSGPRRAALLEAALAQARSGNVQEPMVPAKKKAAVLRAPSVWDTRTMFWKMAENANGRAAALGFVLCLMREALEPGHPTLFAQVREVLIPVAVATPPFLVAVVDRLQDIWEIIT